MTERAIIISWLGAFGIVSSIAWAIAIASILAPPAAHKSAKEICALYDAARNTPFCMEIAKSQ